MWGKACSRDFLEWNSWLRGKVISSYFSDKLHASTDDYHSLGLNFFALWRRKCYILDYQVSKRYLLMRWLAFPWHASFFETPIYMSIHLSKLVLLLSVLVRVLIWLMDLVLAWSTFLFRIIPWPSPCQGGSSLCYFQQICHPTPFQEIQQRSGFLSPANWRSCIHWRGKRHQCCCGQFLCLHWQKLCHRQKMYNKRLCLYRGWDYFTPWNSCARF